MIDTFTKTASNLKVVLEINKVEGMMSKEQDVIKIIDRALSTYN